MGRAGGQAAGGWWWAEQTPDEYRTRPDYMLRWTAGSSRSGVLRLRVRQVSRPRPSKTWSSSRTSAAQRSWGSGCSVLLDSPWEKQCGHPLVYSYFPAIDTDGCGISKNGPAPVCNWTPLLTAERLRPRAVAIFGPCHVSACRLRRKPPLVPCFIVISPVHVPMIHWFANYKQITP